MKDCKTSAKAAAYKTLIRPTLEYASVVWDPYTKANVQQLEKVQRRAARFATGNHTDYTPGAVTGLLKDLGWDTLERRQTRNRLSMFYKIQHGQAEVTTENIIPGDKRTRGRHRIREIPSSKDYHRYSFFPRTIRQWNVWNTRQIRGHAGQVTSWTPVYPITTYHDIVLFVNTPHEVFKIFPAQCQSI